MLISIADSMAVRAGSLETKITFYIVIGIVAIVIINNLLDGIRTYIRGLDSAALGGIFLYLAHMASGIPLVKHLAGLLTLVGVTLCASGLLVFIVTRLFKGKARRRMQEREWDPKIETEEEQDQKDNNNNIE